MNPGNYWNLNPTANFAGFPYKQAQNVRRWSIPTYDEDQASSSHALGLIFQRTVQEPWFQSVGEDPEIHPAPFSHHCYLSPTRIQGPVFWHIHTDTAHVTCSFIEKKKRKEVDQKQLNRVSKILNPCRKQRKHRNTSKILHTLWQEKLKSWKWTVSTPIGLKRAINFSSRRKSKKTLNAQFARISSIRLWRHSVNIIYVQNVMVFPCMQDWT